MKKKYLYLPLLGTLVSCAVSRTVQYDRINANVPEFSEKISIATWDQREQIINGSQKPNLVGYMRSAVGIAWPVSTKSNKPLADDISSSISSSLEKKGSTTSIITTQPAESENAIIDKLKKANSNKLILVKCAKFQTDGYGSQSLDFDLQVNIFSSNGDILKHKNFTGNRDLGGSVAWGPGKFKEYMPAAFKKLLEEIFNDPEIISVLKK